MSTPPYYPEDDADELDNTQRNPTDTQPLPPLPPPPPGSRGHVQPHFPERRTVRGRERRGTGELRPPGAAPPPPPPASLPRPARLRQRERSKADSGLFLPAWSVILMLVVVFAIAGGIVLLVMTLGGNASPGGAARVVIITAVPSDTPIARAQEVIPTLPASGGTPGALPTFALEGPSLPTAVLTPTPVRINVGTTVEVINVGEAQLNVRESPGTTAEVVTRAREGDTFIVIGGPETAEDLTWWELQSTSNSSVSGWAVENDGEQDVLGVVPPTLEPTESANI